MTRKRHREKAVRLSRAFFGFDPRRLHRIRITWPKAVSTLGGCAAIEYVCDKFDGKVRQYRHEFEGSCMVLAAPDCVAPGKRMLIVVGDFEITKDGIKG